MIARELESPLESQFSCNLIILALDCPIWLYLPLWISASTLTLYAHLCSVLALTLGWYRRYSVPCMLSVSLVWVWPNLLVALVTDYTISSLLHRLLVIRSPSRVLCTLNVGEPIFVPET